MAQNTYFEHNDSYDARTRTNTALRFLENYTARIDSADYSGSYLPYYHPNAVFHVDYVGSDAVWK
jgi:hypothetical protein